MLSFVPLAQEDRSGKLLLGAMNCHLASVGTAVIHESTTPRRGWRGGGERGTLVPGSCESRPGQPLREAVRRFLRQLKIDLIYDPATPILASYLKKSKC